MSDLVLLLLIVALLVCLLVTVGAFLFYSGLVSDVDVGTGPPPVRNVTIAYKFKEGSYKDCGSAYTETCSIGPALSAIGLFYDDPEQRPAEKCRYAVGSILSEGEELPDQELQRLYEKFGFRVFSLPEVSHAVTSSFPCTSPLSHVLGPYRVYPRLTAYIQERKLCAFPFIEICGSDVIKYMAPLSRQPDFFVPEMKEEVKSEVKDDDSDEDRGTDITGADSHSDVSSVSGGVPWDSRETSLAASTAASLASSLPLRDVMDAANQDVQQRDSERDESVGSGSSFEELDMDQEEEEEREERAGGLGEEEQRGEGEEQREEGPEGAEPPEDVGGAVETEKKGEESVDGEE